MTRTFRLAGREGWAGAVDIGNVCKVVGAKVGAKGGILVLGLKA